MGIPFYFKTLINTHGSSILQGLKYMEECDSLYLDFNSLIHQSANNVVKQKPDLNHNEYYLPIFNEILLSMINIINTVRPRKQLYIAIDGICPRAKMQQQRKRRYMKIWKQQNETEKNGTNWDSNVITPGTDFMIFLDNELELFIQKNKDKFKFEIILSKSSDVGEGEHKIYKIIDENEDAVVYGLDADLIMLSLISKNKKIRLLRESEFINIKNNVHSKFSILKIKELRKHIIKEYGIDINDYVMLCVLLGNDFLPPLSYLSLRNNGLDLILNAYKEVQESPIISEHTIDFDIIYKIFHLLANNENKKMKEVCKEYYKVNDSPSCLDSYPQYHKCEYVIDPETNANWRDAYYKYLVKETNISKPCEDYMNGLYWIFSYYFLQQASNNWYYPYSYSPTIYDLSLLNYKPILNIEDNFIINEKLQLLLVLPPQSSHLLHTNLKAIMNETSKGCCQYYPTSFKVSTFLKTYLWECIPILPDINIKTILKTFN